MTNVHLEHEDHKKILAALECSQAVAALDKDVSLLHLMIKEMKSDRDKAQRMLMWVCAMAFSIIMATAGSLINSSATVSVLEEKITEQKSEIEQLRKNQDNIVSQFNDALSNHKH